MQLFYFIVKVQITKQKIKNRLIWLPTKKEGEAVFNGIPTPSEEVLISIGENGVNHIINELEKKLKMSKELFGSCSPKLYGLNSHQRFLDLQERIIIDVKAIIDRPKELSVNEFLQDYRIEIDEKKFPYQKQLYPSDIKVKKIIKSGFLFNDSLFT